MVSHNGRLEQLGPAVRLVCCASATRLSGRNGWDALPWCSGPDTRYCLPRSVCALVGGGKGSSSASGALAVTVAQYSGEVTPKDLVKGEDSGTVVRDRLRNSVAADGPAKRARAASDLAEGAMTAIVGSGLGTV